MGVAALHGFLNEHPLRLGCWRQEAERFLSGANGGTKEVAKRRSQAPNGSAARLLDLIYPLVTSARFCGVERAWSRGRQGRPAARGAKQLARWSRRCPGGA